MFDVKREVEKCEFFIKNIFEYKGFKKAIIGISGGLDSAVVAYLCVRALGKRSVNGFMLPYGEQHDIGDAKLVCNNLNLSPIVTYDIWDICKEFGSEDKTRLGNIKARVRMIILFDFSNRLNALVVGTSNKTELDLGYFTIHGDGACALEPLGHLYKTQVREIAKEIGIPKNIIDKPPSAGLWVGQTDEEEIGCSYENIDKILKIYNSLMYDPNNWRVHTKQQIVDAIIYNHKDLDIKTIDKIITRVEKNRFKLEAPAMLGDKYGNI